MASALLKAVSRLHLLALMIFGTSLVVLGDLPMPASRNLLSSIIALLGLVLGFAMWNAQRSTKIMFPIWSALVLIRVFSKLPMETDYLWPAAVVAGLITLLFVRLNLMVRIDLADVARSQQV